MPLGASGAVAVPGLAAWRALVSGLLLALALPALAAKSAAPPRCSAWPAWEAFKARFVSADGRVVDPSTPQAYTVSEGQAYALFFALVADDRASFGRLLSWTENNLAQGDFTAHLPAWQWGRREDGSWGVVDSNPASDADLFIAYVLGEAARRWNHRPWRILSALIAARILEREVRAVPGLGPTLLPAPVGFEGEGTWRLNPSYAPLMLIRGLHTLHPAQGWDRLLPSTRRLLVESAPRGYAPDWTLWKPEQGFVADADTAGVGSYGAIRVYLWAGMLAPQDPDRAALLAALRPMAEHAVREGAPPRQIDTRTGEVRSAPGPSGFSAALLPFLEALGLDAAVQQQLARLETLRPGDADNYYDQVLRLFGQGWQQQRYRFSADGSLLPQGPAPCRADAPL